MNLPFDINSLGDIGKQLGNFTNSDVANLNWKLVGYDSNGNEKMKVDVPLEQIIELLVKNKDIFNK